MARLDYIDFTVHVPTVTADQVLWAPRVTPTTGVRIVKNLPHFFWADGRPWLEGNLWASRQVDRILSGELKLKTIQTSALAIHAYMQFLEAEEIDWWHFPPEREKRCLIRYRGFLIKCRTEGKITASTTSSRMSTVISFYRWIRAEHLLTTAIQPFSERVVGIRVQDTSGFRRTIGVTTTDLAIPNRGRSASDLEDGLLPVSLEERNRILAFAELHCSEELYLMLALGFGTGMRLGSITDLKIRTLLAAQPDSHTDKLHYLTIGPGVKYAPVHTKFDVDGQVIIPTILLERLQVYVNSPRRLKREAAASGEAKHIVFLNRYGKPFSRGEDGRSPSVNTEMTRLRCKARTEGLNLDNFKFHRSRATFATSIADTAISMSGASSVGNIVQLIRDLLLHKDEATSMRYIKFVRNQKVKAQWANEFTRLFVGAAMSSDNA
ncbi:hypothetical protein R75461_04986 [Paraburkholderia nemoris]|uniref:tyrosine-type recombinase/integrase n=1 Tax=Paraburkholderia nemoris TaxID=2793076 RepID=UPI00190A3F5C|nr:MULTISPECIES: tyrosine-type recombinase/integrase [Paraburkholderia]MBK3780768.1 tyrosine-type recombinase/integrase [Paraburkholderia aspalathi]CAE6796705.1 hypothetical protein R75461_04986 [Paraburkholderia nemoris]